MNILLDTHILLWWSDEPERLSSSAMAILTDTHNTLFLSIASVWETQVKINLGKLTPRRPLPETIRTQLETNGVRILPIELPHIYELSNLPHHHRDPFDRLIIAQSRMGKMPVLTADSVFSSYDIQILN